MASAFSYLTSVRAITFLLRRYLLPRQDNLLSFALWISVVGVALGIIQLMLVLSVMSGFQDYLRKSYTRITSELVVLPRLGQSGEVGKKLRQVDGIEAVTPFALGQAMVIKAGGVGGVVLEGIDPVSSSTVTPWNQIWIEPPLKLPQENDGHWIWLGVQLARKLGAKPGDRVNLFIPDQKSRVFPFTVTAVTRFGIYEHDLHYARMDLKVLDDLFRQPDSEPMYKCLLRAGHRLEDVVRSVRDTLGRTASLKKWSDINKNLFQAVQHQKLLLFLVLEIIIALAAINVVNLLMMSSHQRRRDIAILRSMGMRLHLIFFFFVAQGAAVALSGVILGAGAGYVVCHLVERFQPSILNESVYNVARLPISIEWKDVGLIGICALVLCVVFSVVPALRAALSRPVEALRYE